MYCTPAETLKARKPHRCDSCGEPIAASEIYRRWTCFDDAATTNKMHPECFAMHDDDAHHFGEGQWEYSRFGSERPSSKGEMK